MFVMTELSQLSVRSLALIVFGKYSKTEGYYIDRE